MSNDQELCIFSEGGPRENQFHHQGDQPTFQVADKKKIYHHSIACHCEIGFKKASMKC